MTTNYDYDYVDLVRSTRFPVDAPIAELEALGFLFGPVDAQDPIFRPALLPEGWSRKSTDHPMWSRIVDERGRERVAIFYKAAYLERYAHADLVRPTARLDELIRANAEPSSLPLDDLLSARDARAYLERERDTNNKRLRSWTEGDPLYVARGERIEAMLALLPADVDDTPSTADDSE